MIQDKYLQATSNLEYLLFITSLAIIPSNENIVSGSIKGSINVWNSTTFQLIATFQAHTDLVQSPFGPSNFGDVDAVVSLYPQMNIYYQAQKTKQ